MHTLKATAFFTVFCTMVTMMCFIDNGAAWAGTVMHHPPSFSCLNASMDIRGIQTIEQRIDAQNKKYMREAIKEAKQRKRADVADILDGHIYPKVGAVLVINSRIYGRGHNRAQTLLHAEYYAVIDTLTELINARTDWSVFKRKACLLRLSTAIELSKFFNRVYLTPGDKEPGRDMQTVLKLLTDRTNGLDAHARQVLAKQIYNGELSNKAIFAAVDTLLMQTDDELGNPLRKPGVALYVTLAPCDKCSTMITKLKIPSVYAAYPAVNAAHKQHRYGFFYQEGLCGEEAHTLIAGYEHEQTNDPVMHSVMQKEYTYAASIFPHQNESRFIKRALKVLIDRECAAYAERCEYVSLLREFENDLGDELSAPFFYCSKIKRGRFVSITHFGDYTLRIPQAALEKILRGETNGNVTIKELLLFFLTEYLSGKDDLYLRAHKRTGELKRVALRCANEIAITAEQLDGALNEKVLSRLIVRNLLSSSRPDIFDTMTELHHLLHVVARLVRKNYPSAGTRIVSLIDTMQCTLWQRNADVKNNRQVFYLKTHVGGRTLLYRLSVSGPLYTVQVTAVPGKAVDDAVQPASFISLLSA